MREYERGESGSAFCGIKVFMYFGGKTHGQSFSFYDRVTKTYLEGDARNPLRKAARKEKARLVTLRAKFHETEAAHLCGKVTRSATKIHINLGMPAAYISAVAKGIDSRWLYFDLAIRGTKGYRSGFPTSFKEFKKTWTEIATLNAKNLGYKSIPKQWSSIKPTKEAWENYLNTILKFTKEFAGTNYVIEGEKLRNANQQASQYDTGFNGLTYKVILTRRIAGGGILTGKINISALRALRVPNKPTKTRSFHIYNYTELVEQWPHAINAYCEICKVPMTKAMLDAIPSRADFKKTFAMGRIQFDGLLSDGPNPAKRQKRKPKVTS